MGKRLRSGFNILMILTCIIILFVHVWVFGAFRLDDSKIRFQHANTFDDGWSVVADGIEIPTEELTRDLLAVNGALVLKNTLPEFCNNGYCLCFRTDNETVRVFVDDKQVYTYGCNDDTPTGDHFGVVWLTVPLDETDSGKDIRIELTSLNSHINPGRYEFYLDQHSAIFLTLLSGNAFTYCNSILGLSWALIIIISAFLHTGDGKRVSLQRLHLGVFVLICHIWLLSDTVLFQYIFKNKAVAYMVTHTAFMLMPVPFVLYMSSLFPRHEKKYHIIAIGFCGYYLLRMLLYALNVCELSDAVFITHMLIVVGVCYAIALNFVDSKSKFNKKAFAGMVGFFVFVVLAILDFYLYPHLPSSPIDYTLIMGLGIDVLLVAFYYEIVKNQSDIEIRSLRFERQAYTDAMTQVKNRAAFNVVMETLDPVSYPRLTLFMVDLNNLKAVNDSMGHPAGDKLICALVHYLKNSFQDLGKIYRYGGDEFVVIIEDSPLRLINEAHERFDEMIQKHSENGTYEISVAVGMASRQDPQNAAIHVSELLHLADMAMYRIKARQKSTSVHEQLPRYHWMGQIDSVTGILTFSAFKARLYEALMSTDNTFPCIVNFDLNFFDGYNNLFGWEAGNQLLQKLTTMAMSISGKKGFCAHGEADSFWVFVDTPNLEVLTRCITTEARDFQERMGDCRLFPSFGIYCCTDLSTPITDMCSRANLAKKGIKGHFDTLYAVYDPESHLRRIDNMRLTSYMQKGLDSDEFIPYFQPKFSAEDSRLIGAEVLARWSQEPGQPLSPSEFASLFENSGLIISLDWYMLDKACAFLRRQMDAGIECVPLSINFSRLHVYEDDCIKRLTGVVDRYRLPRKLIEIELTETTFVQSADRVKDLVNGLRAEGINVSMDDFGSGFSSLGLFKFLAVDTIKIDRSLVTNSTNGDMDNSILKFVISMCSHLNVRTVAEGVETKEQFDRVRECGCDMIQGNYLAAALTEADFEALLAKNKA